MKNNRKPAKLQRITKADYLKAIRKADREIDLAQQPGWKSVHKVFKSKKVYDRKTDKRSHWGDE